jgi:hypothetical protein
MPFVLVANKIFGDVDPLSLPVMCSKILEFEGGMEDWG